MEKASMASVKLYLSEVYQFWRNYCYFLDVLLGILLWRGRAAVSFLGYEANIWFPVHSVWLFVSVTVAYERPSFAPAMFFYGLAWIMISLNHYNSRHPYWGCRVKRFESLVMGILRGTASPSITKIEANAFAKEKDHHEALDNLKADRMMALISAFLSTGLKAYSIYSGTSIASKFLSEITIRNGYDIFFLI
jgi:hypothetical protein